jgi:hypothetical protein
MNWMPLPSSDKRYRLGQIFSSVVASSEDYLLSVVSKHDGRYYVVLAFSGSGHFRDKVSVDTRGQNARVHSKYWVFYYLSIPAPVSPDAPDSGF